MSRMDSDQPPPQPPRFSEYFGRKAMGLNGLENLKPSEPIILTAKDAEFLVDLIDSPDEEPNDALKKAAKRYRQEKPQNPIKEKR